MIKMINTSFRDNSGFIFKSDEIIYRQINQVYREDYEYLLSSGLYDELVNNGLLISHEEVNLDVQRDENFYKIIKPKQIKYISYPYEWCFSELKDAALLTLKIQETALKYNMVLKDASSYNIQFINGKPIFIDTLSFEKYEENKPWVAYGQFCRHFLAPLALMSLTDISLNSMLITNIDGIPLDLCSKLLPLKSRLNPELLIHIFLHSASNKAHEEDTKVKLKNKFSRLEMESLIDSLKSTISHLNFPKIKTEWGEYYNNTNYTNKGREEKEEIIKEFINKIEPQTICDLGANKGDFSRIATSCSSVKTCISFDIAPRAVEGNYKISKGISDNKIQPLIVDLTNPSPAIGFANCEREDFLSRFKCDTVLALALIHHLSISNNLPFDNTAQFFAKLGNYLIIEFIPKQDSKVQTLLGTRKDIFDKYNIDEFEKVYSKYFEILDKRQIDTSERILYIMRRK